MKGTHISSRTEFPLKFDSDSDRERATWVYGILRGILDVPISRRTEVVSRLAESIDRHPHREDIRGAFRDFWPHHSYVRVISEAGLPDEIFLLRELYVRAAKRLMPEDEVQGDLYILLDSLGLTERDAAWLAALPDSHLRWWADIFRLSKASPLASSKILRCVLPTWRCLATCLFWAVMTTSRSRVSFICRRWSNRSFCIPKNFRSGRGSEKRVSRGCANSTSASKRKEHRQG
jgi:hypothetical protein